MTRVRRGPFVWLWSCPAPIWTIAAFYLVGATGCLIVATFPISPQAPRLLVASFGGVCLVLGLGLFVAGRNVGIVVLEVLGAFGVAGISTLIALSKTYEGLLLAAFTYMWVVIYAAYNFSTRATYLFLALVTGGYGAALLANPMPKAYVAWVLTSGTLWMTGAVLSHLASGLRTQADTDPLTGLLNRRGFVNEVAKVREVARRLGQAIAVVVIDLDGFKAVNDLEGHEAGDQVLAEVASTWRMQLRPGEIVGRFGGDEFVLLLSDCPIAAVPAVLERVRRSHPVAWSTGVASWQEGESFDEALRRADADLYATKAARQPSEEAASAFRAPVPSQFGRRTGDQRP